MDVNVVQIWMGLVEETFPKRLKVEVRVGEKHESNFGSKRRGRTQVSSDGR